MDKNTPAGATVPLWKGWAAVIMLCGMIAGLVGARAVASIAMMLFGIATLYGVHPKMWLRQRWWLFGTIWIALYALSGLWTANIPEWNAHLQVKLPFLLLPLGFAFLPRLSVGQLRFFTWVLTGIMVAGACFTLSAFWRAPAAAIDSYKYAHVLPTPMYNDHIAFSAAVALTVAWTGYFALRLAGRWERRILLMLAALLSIYLHILAAKTGLVALYVLFAGVAFYYLRKRPRIGLLLLAGIIVSVVAALSLLPTFRERIGYSYVTWRAYHEGERSGIYSDAGRVFSYDLAARYIAAHPLGGAGAGDVLDEMRKEYAAHYPQVPGAQQLWPHNQFLTCAMAAGIPAAVAFVFWILAPLRLVRRSRRGYMFGVIWAMLLVPLMVDPFLEVQAGVGVFLIFFLWQRKSMMDDERDVMPVEAQDP